MENKKIETEEEKNNREMVEGIANNISSLSRSVKSILGGKLNRKALVILLTASSRLHQYQVENMLTALENLEKDWLNK